MPASYRIDKSLGLVFIKAEGVLIGQDILTTRQRIREDPDFDPSYDQLVDLREVIEIPDPTAQIRATATFDPFNEKSRKALVADKDVVFAKARMHESLRGSDPDRVKVFRDMAEARRWLGLD